MYVCMYVCLYVCMFVCMYVCMYVMLLLICSLYHLRQTFMGRIVTVIFLYPVVTLFMNNQITLCSYYVQLFATLCEQLRTIVHNVMRLFFTIVRSYVVQGQGVARCTVAASITSQFRELLSKKPSRC